jgi:glucose-6-phosphate 1-dehydrogenase
MRAESSIVPRYTTASIQPPRARTVSRLSRRKGVADASQIETFAALRLQIRYVAVGRRALLIRAGKCMPVTRYRGDGQAEAAAVDDLQRKRSGAVELLSLSLSPEVVISAGTMVKLPGEEMRGEATNSSRVPLLGAEISPYIRLLSDAIRGDTSLFTSKDSVEAAWRVIDPVLRDAAPVVEYDKATWGPAAAARIIADGQGWHDPKAGENKPC